MEKVRKSWKNLRFPAPFPFSRAKKLLDGAGSREGCFDVRNAAMGGCCEHRGLWPWVEAFKGAFSRKTSRLEMKVDYLSLCYRGSDNPAFIWFCDFLSKASRLSCDYQSRFGLASTKDSEVRHRALKTMVKYNGYVCAMCVRCVCLCVYVCVYTCACVLCGSCVCVLCMCV